MNVVSFPLKSKTQYCLKLRNRKREREREKKQKIGSATQRIEYISIYNWNRVCIFWPHKIINSLFRDWN